MIIDSINSCITAINQKQEAQRNKQSHEEYQQVLALLNKACVALKGTLDTADSFVANKITDESPLSSESKKGLSDSVNQCGQALNKGQLSKETVQVMNALIKQAKTDLSASWKQCSAQYANGVSGYLGIVQGLTDNPTKVKTLIDSITSGVNGEPSSAAAQKLSADVSAANSIIARFSLKPEIEVFLKKVAAKQATVLDLTPEVVKWLKDQQLQSKLKVSF